jgi:hypothetical protein
LTYDGGKKSTDNRREIHVNSRLQDGWMRGIKIYNTGA